MKKELLFILLLLASCRMVAQESTIQAPLTDVNKVIDNTLDSLNVAKMSRPIAGSSRKASHPVLFLVGNSTMRTGTKGDGNNGQWGWGFYAANYFDEKQLTVENHALGGTSSRTFYNRLWPEVLKGIQPGDWVIIELGHNDNGPYNEGRARASIPGIGKDSLHVIIKETGVAETVYTYGEYMRRFIDDVKSKGAHPILMSLTPRNAWVDADSTIIARVDKTFGLWAKQVAEECNVPFIDLNDITARKFETFGKEKVKYMFYLDRIHTSSYGAQINAASAAEGIRSYQNLALAHYLKPIAKDSITGASRKGTCPVLFTIGDSTVKNKDNDKEDMWGWGSVIGELFDNNKITVENHAMAGRSSRTFLDEGRWDKVYNALQPGDFVLIQFGHNDGGDINVGKARGELPGAGNESQVFLMEPTGRYQVIYTYGWYVRKFIRDAQEKGAIPIVLSHTPRNKWNSAGKIERNTDSYGRWTKEAAMQTNACFIDLNKLSADKLQQMGKKKAAAYFKKDHTHASLQGAKLNAKSIAEGLKQSDCSLKELLK